MQFSTHVHGISTTVLQGSKICFSSFIPQRITCNLCSNTLIRMMRRSCLFSPWPLLIRTSTQVMSLTNCVLNPSTSQLYTSHLYLTLHYLGDHLHFENCMHSHFSCYVYTESCFSGHSHFTVTNCMPEVEGLEDMVQQLNTTNNFSKFVLSMRQKFKDFAN